MVIALPAIHTHHTYSKWCTFETLPPHHYCPAAPLPAHSRRAQASTT